MCRVYTLPPALPRPNPGIERRESPQGCARWRECIKRAMRCKHLADALVACFVLIGYADFAQAQEPLSLKGFSLGQEMPKCPPETTSAQTKDSRTMCQLGPTTLANQPADWHAVIIIDGKVSGVFVKLPSGGPHAYSSVRDALVEKFGQPTSNKPHINEARWNIGGGMLSFDGWKGMVLMTDLEANSRRAGEAAKENKKDL